MIVNSNVGGRACVSQAINYCKCKNHPAFASAFSAGGAEAFKDRIVADVAADASAAVCVDSDGGGTATASVDTIAQCIEIKYAYVMAEVRAAPASCARSSRAACVAK